MTIAVVTLGVVAVIQLVVIGWMMWMRRDDGRDIIALADGLAKRIQAPQLAAVEAANEEGPLYAPPALIPDDDDAYWESREQLAERLMAEEVKEAGGGDR